MALRKILTTQEPALHKVCKPVEKFDWRLHRLLDDMADTLAEANGVGLAAPQVGILRRVVIVDTGEKILELVNPTLVETSGEQIGAEGCLSVPGKYGLVKRPYYAKVRAQDRNGEWFEAEGEELIGRCFCHELDHLDGIVYTEVMERFLTEEELAATANNSAYAETVQKMFCAAPIVGRVTIPPGGKRDCADGWFARPITGILLFLCPLRMREGRFPSPTVDAHYYIPEDTACVLCLWGRRILRRPV